MITTINEWKKIYENSRDEFIEAVNTYLPKNLLLEKRNMEVYIFSDAVCVGDLRYDYIGKYVTIEMIHLQDEHRRKGIAYSIYDAFFNAAINAGMLGLMSPAFDSAGSGQQRSPAATALLTKLLNANDGRIVDVSENLDMDEIKKDIANGLPYYGPPFYDIYIEGKKIVTGLDL